ncbi:MAG: M12 family metallo-peptidase [Chloroflexota bacterium]
MVKLKTLAFLALICILSARTAFPQSFEGKSLLSKINSKRYSGDKLLGMSDKYSTLAEFNMSFSQSEEIFNSNSATVIINDFPTDPISFDKVELRRTASAADQRTKWYKVERGQRIPVESPKIVTYRGRISGRENSDVVLTYYNGYLNGYVKKADGEYYDITSSGKSKIAVTAQNLQYLMGDYDPSEGLKSDLDAPESARKAIKERLQADIKPDFTKLLECRVGIDAPNSFYEMMNRDYDKAAAYIASVMAHVSILYEEAINVRITIPMVLIRTTKEGDPFAQYDEKDFYSMLFKMPDVWKSLRSEDLSLICLFVGNYSTNTGGTNGSFSIGGISYGGEPGVGSLCDTSSGYCLLGIKGGTKYPNYNYTWDVSVTAHEMGHNFGAPHTHSCYYEPDLIDTCVTQTQPTQVWDACLDGANVPRLGTIMSYCHIANETHSVELKFHPRQIPEMRQAALNSACVKEADYPYVKIIAPLEDNRFVTGDDIEVRWVFAKVEKVDVYYSWNSGINWKLMAGRVPAADGKCLWKAPHYNTDEMIFKVVDSDDEDVFDVSDSWVKIIIPAITISAPGENESYSVREKLEAMWMGTVSKNYNVYFSSDAGNKWTLISGATAVNTLKYDLPDIVSDSCLVQVEDADNPAIYATSPVFKLGHESFEFTYPMPGETLCGLSDYDVKWNSSNLNEFKLQWSSDGGSTWKFVKLGAKYKANAGKLTWKTPGGPLNRVRLRAVMTDEAASVATSLAGDVIIDTCKTSGVDDAFVREGSLSIISAAPNPAGEEISLRINCARAGSEITLSVVNAIGTSMIPDAVCAPIEGVNEYKLDLRRLASGRYFVVARSQDGLQVYPISVIK